MEKRKLLKLSTITSIALSTFGNTTTSIVVKKTNNKLSETEAMFALYRQLKKMNGMTTISLPPTIGKSQFLNYFNNTQSQTLT